MSESCEHHWNLCQEDPIIRWTYPLGYTFFRKRITINDSFTKAEPHTIGFIRRWYCSKCRKFDLTDTYGNIQLAMEALANKTGRAVYDSFHDKYIMPKDYVA